MACTFVAVAELEDIVSVEKVEDVEDVEDVEKVENIAVYDLVVDDNAVRYLIMDLTMLNHERVGIQRSIESREMERKTLSVEPNYYYYESNKDENYREHVKERQK
jgi:hypothetical protein